MAGENVRTRVFCRPAQNLGIVPIAAGGLNVPDIVIAAASHVARNLANVQHDHMTIVTTAASPFISLGVRIFNSRTEVCLIKLFVLVFCISPMIRSSISSI